MVSEITEAWDEDAGFVRGDDETQKQRIRQIIRYQKSMCGPSIASSSASSSSSSYASSSSSLSSSGRNGKLLELMKGRASSLKRLFDMDSDARLSMVSPQLERGYSSRMEVSDSPTTSRRTEDWRCRRVVRNKVRKPTLFSRLQGVAKWRRWRKFGFRLRFRRFKIRICWSKH